MSALCPSNISLASLMQMLRTDKQYTWKYMKWTRKSDSLLGAYHLSKGVVTLVFILAVLYLVYTKLFSTNVNRTLWKTKHFL